MLVGREGERQALDRLLASARSGRSAILALVGEAGIGKTALLQYAADNAGSLRILRARGVVPEANVPFAGLFELLRPALALLPRIPPPQAAALETALALRPGAGGDRFAVGAATLSLLAAYADEGPALVLLDDAHLLDASSAEAVLFALRRLLAEPIGVVVAARDDEPSVIGDADLPRIALAGLDLASATELLGRVDRATAERVHTTTAGNPLALIELRDEVDRIGDIPVAAPLPVPDRVARAFALRAQELPDEARHLLTLIAAGGADDVALLQRTAGSLGLDPAALGQAEAAGLLDLEGGRVEFRHPLARAAAYAEAPPDWRRQVHRAIAGALPDRDADRRAWHLALAAVGSDEDAATALEQAAARARDRRAYAAAAGAYARAADLAGGEARRSGLLYAAADAAWLAGLGTRAAELLTGANTLDPAPELRLHIEHLRGRIAVRRGPVMEGHAILVAAADAAAVDDPDLAIAILAEAADACFFAGEAHEMAAIAQRAAGLLDERPSERTAFYVAMIRGMALVFAGQGEAGIASIRDGIALAEASTALREDPQLLPWLAMGTLWLRDRDAERALVEAAVDTARADAALGTLPWLLDRIARSHAAGEDWSRARVEYDEAIQLARETGQDAELAAALAGLAWLEAHAGREDACRAHAAEALGLCARLGVGLYETWVLRALGDLELGLGNAEGAIAHLQRSADRLEGLGVADVDLSPAAELVDAYLRVGRVPEAAACAETLHGQATAKGQPWSLARAARCRGMVADGGWEAHFEEALSLHAQTPDMFEAARTQLAFGARLRRERQRVRAREHLRAALAALDRLGARSWATLAELELAATGETARRRDPSTLDDLTPRELHIARLLAEGRTTREAAAALFLSPKTIEYHLRSAYRKLGVKTRQQLADLFDDV